ncbi:MAG: glycosyltransferase family 2 protein [Acidimicrobiales bacterium]
MSIKESVSAKLERLIRRSMADEASRSEETNAELRALRDTVANLHREVFEWCGDLAARSGEIMARTNELAVRCDDLAHRQQELVDNYRSLPSAIESLDQKNTEALSELREIAVAVFDDVPALVQRLYAVRGSAEYWAAFSEPRPLVTVTIATYNRAKILCERTIPSVLAQTYDNFEVVIVGDGCDEETEERLAAFSDPRIRFINLPYRTPYPSEPRRRWEVAGGPGKNLAAELARGHWLALIDDDDEFSPDHIEVLVDEALRGRHEMVCGRMLVMADKAIDHNRVIGTFPPSHGEFNFMNSLVMRALRFFTFDLNSWVLDEASDWQRCRRMLEAGVNVGWVEDILGTVYPTGPRKEKGDGTQTS